MSTFSKVRVGAKPYLAGSAKLTLAVDASSTGAKGTLPPGVIVLGGVASEDDCDCTVSDGTTTANVDTTTAGSAITVDPAVIEGPGVINVTTAAAGGIIYIDYIINDAKSGANA